MPHNYATVDDFDVSCVLIDYRSTPRKFVADASNIAQNKLRPC